MTSLARPEAAVPEAIEAIHALSTMSLQSGVQICTHNVGGIGNPPDRTGRKVTQLRNDLDKSTYARDAIVPEAVKPSTKAKIDTAEVLSERTLNLYRSCAILCLQEVGARGFLDKLQTRLNDGTSGRWQYSENENFKEVVTFWNEASFDRRPSIYNLVGLITDNFSQLDVRQPWIDGTGRDHPIVQAFRDRTTTVLFYIDRQPVYVVNIHHFSKRNNQGVFRFVDGPGHHITLLGALCKVLRKLAQITGMRFVLVGDKNVKLNVIEGNSAFEDETQQQAAYLTRYVPRGVEGIDWAIRFGKVRTTPAGHTVSTEPNSTQMASLERIFKSAQVSSVLQLNDQQLPPRSPERLKQLEGIRDLDEKDEKIFVAHNSSDHPPVIFQVESWN